ncbi:MAG TPA: ceramidase domain-containing protein [Myxococcota bacterium]|nr:ceramidase domain-containing protein [Myxococcota bacterium]
MAPGCPWSEIANLWLPNIKWCEAQVCSLVVEPANTWSNLAYILIGLLLLARSRRRRHHGAPHRMARTFGTAEIIVGVFSFAFHMSYSGLLQVLDFAAMFVFVGLTLSLNLVRLGWLPERLRVRVYVLGVVTEPPVGTS